MLQAHLARYHPWLPLVAVLMLSACDTTPRASRPEPEPALRAATDAGPAGAAPGSCWGRSVQPAVIETVTEQVRLTDAAQDAGDSMAALPVYRTETRQKIVSPRREDWFETPCDEVLTAEFVASLQRALQVRGFHRGAISGRLDGATRRAVRAFQLQSGLDSAVLSLAAARRLGLIAVPRA
ncbi:peptidoglycan-binding protein [Sulfitobacter aestuarii]|uniref:Peptidoglycan-binding protein n=1 Tax=Sulfitobacter aestuarii TaxID=2161676 RepID=A0ABW5TYT8_9RHOB